MKINFRGGVKTFSGFWDDYVYMSCLNRDICIGRDYTYPTLTDNNHRVGTIAKNLKVIYKTADAAYIADFKLYRYRYKQLGIPRNPNERIMVPGDYALFNKMMYSWQASDPTTVDLATVTIADIVALDADVRTLARAVEAGFLRTVSKYDDLTHDIQ